MSKEFNNLNGGLVEGGDEGHLSEARLKSQLALLYNDYYEARNSAAPGRDFDDFLARNSRPSEEEGSHERISKEELQAEYDRLQTELGVSASLNLDQTQWDRSDQYREVNLEIENIVGTIDGNKVQIGPRYMEINDVGFISHFVSKDKTEKSVDLAAKLHKKYVMLARLGQAIHLIDMKEQFLKDMEARKQRDLAIKEQERKKHNANPEEIESALSEAEKLVDKN